MYSFVPWRLVAEGAPTFIFSAWRRRRRGRPRSGMGSSSASGGRNNPGRALRRVLALIFRPAESYFLSLGGWSPSGAPTFIFSTWAAPAPSAALRYGVELSELWSHNPDRALRRVLALIFQACEFVLFFPWRLAAERGAEFHNRKTRATTNQSPLLSHPRGVPLPKGRLRASNWIVQGLYNDAVKKTVELRLLTVFQHVVDPTRVRTVANKEIGRDPSRSSPNSRGLGSQRQRHQSAWAIRSHNGCAIDRTYHVPTNVRRGRRARLFPARLIHEDVCRSDEMQICTLTC